MTEINFMHACVPILENRERERKRRNIHDDIFLFYLEKLRISRSEIKCGREIHERYIVI